MKLNYLLTAIGMTALALAASPASAQSYPTKPIKIVVPFAAGGTTDLLARAVGAELQKSLGQSVIVDNRPGAGGNIGAEVVAKSAPDGYTLLMGTVGTHAINQSLYPKMPFDPIKDFAPVTLVAAVPNVLVLNKDFAANNKITDVKSFTDYVKAHPGKLNMASSGNGTSIHLAGELYKTTTKTFMVHVPYRGSGPALTDLIAGQADLMFDNLPSALPFIKEGRLVPIVVAAPQRLKELPNVPTFKEVGLEPVNRLAYYGIVGPKGLPKDVVDKVHAAVVKALQDPAVRKRIEDTGSIVIGNTPDQFAQQIKAEFDVYKGVVEKAKLKLD